MIDNTKTNELLCEVERLAGTGARWFMSVLEAIPFPVRVADADTSWVYVNAAAEKLFGVKREDMLGKPCDQEKFCICGTDNCSLTRAKRGIMQTFFKHGDASYRVEVELLKNMDGSTAGFIEMIHDITDCANQQENLKSILNGMQALITVCTPEDGKILFLNDSIRQYFEIESDGVGQVCYKLLQGLDEPCPNCPYKELMKEPGMILEWNHKEKVKNRTLRKTARMIDWPGEKKAHLEYAIDITELVETEEMLERRGTMLDALNNAAIIFLSQNEETFFETMKMGIGLIAELADIDMMTISRNVQKEDGVYASHIFTWSKDFGSYMPNQDDPTNSIDKYTPHWFDKLSSGMRINGPVRRLPEAERLASLSAIAIPVFASGEFWGYVLFEDNTREREFTMDEADILRSASFMLVNAVVRNEEAHKIRLAEENAKSMMAEISRKNQLLQAVNQVSSTMLASTADTFDSDLLRSMQIMAKAVEVDRTYIFRNFMKDGRLCYREIYGWTGVGRSEPFASSAIEVEYADVPTWEEALSNGRCVNCIVDELPIDERNLLSPQGVLSIAVMPIFLKGQFWGSVGFDDCKKRRRFSPSEEATLRSASELIADAMIRHEMEKELNATAAELQHALDEAQSANLAKSEFLSSMSHEMRTPLNAVIGMTAIGLRSAEVKRKNYSLGKIEEASTHLLGVINDILDMSKIESRKLELSPLEFNFEQMLQKVISVISYRVNEKNQHFTVSMDGNVPRFVIGDDQRLTQIITNLLANAVKFTPEKGKIHLGVSLVGEENGVNEIRIGVADSGIGITPQQQSKLFQSFQQAESGISREYGGTGLGLAISKRLVELMGGRIWVESEPGKGSRFIFTVKLQNGARNLRSMLKPGVQWENVRVLVVDGSRLTRRQFKESFDRMEVYCETAGDGPAACQIIEKHGGFDVYFIDLYTPSINGVRLTEWIRARGERCAIIMTASTDWEKLQEAVLRSGADKGIVKPVLSSALVDCMNDCLGGPNEGGESENVDEFAGKTLLLAEDIEINREIVLSLLSETGLDIDCAENGGEALALMEAQPDKYDMVFMDMQMPVMDGLEATRRIRAIPEQWCKEIPIIAMTANVFKDDIDNCLKAGMNDHIGKPINFDEMIWKLRKYLLSVEYNRQDSIQAELALVGADEERAVKLTEGTKVSVDLRVFDEQGKRGSLSLPTVVSEIYPDGYFVVEMPKYRGDYYPLPRDEMFLVYFTADIEKELSEMFVIPARCVEKIERDGVAYAKLEPLGKIERSQRRDCYRLPLSLAVEVRQMLELEIGDQPADAKMINFSDGGMLIATDVDLMPGDSVSLDFSIGERETVGGVVLRKEKVEYGRPRFKVAIAFNNASKDQKDRFYNFIMAKQIEKASAMKAEGSSIQLAMPMEGSNAI